MAPDLLLVDDQSPNTNMNTPKVAPLVPTTEPASPPTPEQPRRRRLIHPVFSTHGVGTVRPIQLVGCLALVLSLGTAQAQSDSTVGTALPDTRTQQGWTMWNDKLGTEYGLADDQLQKLRDVDARYYKEYQALGQAPWTDPGYRSLSERRNNDIRGIVAPEMYDRWEQRYGQQPGTRTNAPKAGDGKGTSPGKGTQARPQAPKP